MLYRPDPNSNPAGPSDGGNSQLRLMMMQKLSEEFADVLPLTAAQWPARMPPETDPAKAIAHAVQLLTNYHMLLPKHSDLAHPDAAHPGAAYSDTIPSAKKRDLLNILLACLNEKREHALKTVNFEILSPQEARAAVAEFYREVHCGEEITTIWDLEEEPRPKIAIEFRAEDLF